MYGNLTCFDDKYYVEASVSFGFGQCSYQGDVRFSSLVVENSETISKMQLIAIRAYR